MNTIVQTLLLGAGATAVMDLWGLVRRPLLGMPVPDYATVGRWVGHMPAGRFRHASIASAAPVANERFTGWLVHYTTGIGFAALLVAGTGGQWLRQPTISGAMIMGIGSLVAPFLLVQPATGAGIAASRTPDPPRARLQSAVTHIAFGVGLYISGSLLNALC